MRNKIILGLAISLGLLSACSNDEDIVFSGEADVYVRCQVFREDTLYAPVYAAYANMPMDAATVTLIDDITTSSTDTLTKVNNYTFVSFPEQHDYYSSVTNGKYEFTLVSENRDTIKVSDVLIEDRMDPIKITNDNIFSEEEGLSLEWTPVEGCYVYVVKVVKEKLDGERIYFSPEINKDRTSFTISAGILNGKLELGEEYCVSVSAFKYNSNRSINQESIDFRFIKL